MDLRIKGEMELNQLANKFLNTKVQTHIENVVRQGAYIGERGIKLGIKSMKAIDTGFMVASVRPNSFRFGSSPEVRVGPNADYAVYVHEGHKQKVGRYVPAIGKRLVKPFVKGRPFIPYGVSLVQTYFDDLMKETGEKLATELTK